MAATRKRATRGSLDHTLQNAVRSTGTVYVFPTAYGWVIDRRPPPLSQSFFKVADGKIERVEADRPWERAHTQTS